MRTLDRYIAAAFLKNFILASFTLTSLYMFQQLLGQLIDSEHPAGQTLFYNALFLPDIFVQMTPPSALLATVLTISGLNRTQELVACYSVGFGLSRVVAVIVSITFMIACFTLILQDRILPPVYRKRTTYFWRDMKGKSDFYLDVKQNKIWYRSKNLIYNLRTFDSKSKTIHGMTVYGFDERFRLVQVVAADRAEYTQDGWTLKEGTVTVFTDDDPFPVNQKFKEKSLLISETPRDFQEIEKEVKTLRLKELWKYIERTASAGSDTKAYLVDFHSRISLSFIPLVMAVLGVPFSTRSRREGGMAKDLVACLAITFFYWLFFSVGLSLGTNGALPPVVAAWMPSLIFAVVAGVLVTRKQA